MRVLVTGGHGFVGSHLVRRLVAVGDAVRCVVRSGRPPAALEGLPVEVVAGDLDAPATLERVCDGMDEVYHLAARLTARARREMQRTNVVGTRSIRKSATCSTSPAPRRWSPKMKSRSTSSCVRPKNRRQ